MVLDKMATILFKMKFHWKTKQMATIGMSNMFGILAPTVFWHLVIKLYCFISGIANSTAAGEKSRLL